LFCLFYRFVQLRYAVLLSQACRACIDVWCLPSHKPAAADARTCNSSLAWSQVKNTFSLFSTFSACLSFSASAPTISSCTVTRGSSPFTCCLPRALHSHRGGGGGNVR
jgi:hypothetical protein